MREEDGEDEVRYGKRANTCARAHKPEMENRRHSPNDTHTQRNKREKQEGKKMIKLWNWSDGSHHF